MTPPLLDAAGLRHRPAGDDARIVSLVPSLTELLFDLDLGARVVGRTAFCVHPAGRVRSARSVGGTKVVNWDKLRAVRPTHVVVNVDETPRDLADALSAEGWTVIVTHPIEVRDNLALYRLFGALFDREAEAQTLCARFEAAWTTLLDAARAAAREHVLYLIWTEPWMTVGRDTYIARMLAQIGWLTEPAVAPQRYPVIELDDRLLDRVDRVLFASEPFPFEDRHIRAFRDAHPAHAGKAMPIDAEMVSWYGSRAVAGLFYLARLVGTAPSSMTHPTGAG